MLVLWQIDKLIKIIVKVINFCIKIKTSILLNLILFLQKTTKKHITMAHKISENCIACGTCIDECPVEAISEGDIYKIDPDLCIDCGACAEACPVEAIHPED